MNRPEIRRVAGGVEHASARRDGEFLRALYTRHGPGLLGHALRLLAGDYQRAEDIVQETFLRAWQHRAELDPARAAPWLHTVARNLVVSAHRRTAARPVELAYDGPAPEPRDRVDDDLDRALETWHMADALRDLSPEHRAALVQVYYLRRTVAEAADQLGIPPGTVKSRCYYALRALRAVLEERGVTSP